MSTAYTRTANFITFGGARRSAQMNTELDRIASAIATLLVDPTFTGDARAITRAITDDSTLLATTAFVHDVLSGTLGNLPVQTGHAGKWLKTNGTSASWELLPQQTYAIFNSSTASLQAVSALETIENSLTATGLATTCQEIHYGDSLFLACGGQGNSNANVASSPDGVTWTLRAMPSSAAWCLGTDGTEWVGVVPGATTTATSADGITWASTTALPAAAKATYGLPVFQGSTCFVLSNTAGSAYTSTNYGTSWSTQTLPANAGNMAPFVVGGLIWYWASTTTAYTSTTGTTSSFTARTLPATPDAVWQDFDGSLWLAASGGTTYYRTTDGTNWTDLTLTPPSAIGSTVIRTINGIRAYFSTTFGNAVTRHNNAWVRRVSAVADSRLSYFRCARNTGGTVFLLPHNAGTTGQVGRIAPAEGSAATAIFTS
jgi:hypothetical protein